MLVIMVILLTIIMMLMIVFMGILIWDEQDQKVNQGEFFIS